MGWEDKRIVSPVGPKWGDSIPRARMSELRGFLDTWAFCQPVNVQSQDEGPFSGIKAEWS